MDPALRAICEDAKNFNSFVKALSSRVLVMVGTPSRAYWHFSVQQARAAQDINVPKHSDAICSFCHNCSAWHLRTHSRGICRNWSNFFHKGKNAAVEQDQVHVHPNVPHAGSGYDLACFAQVSLCC